MADTPAASGAKSVFTRHIGPLPMWGWTAIVGGVIVAWAWWSNRNSSSTAGSSTASTANASQVPQFVNQTYTTVQPPTAPAVHVTASDDDDTSPDTDDKKKPPAKKTGPQLPGGGLPKGPRSPGPKPPAKKPVRHKKAVSPGGHPALRRAVRGG